MRLKSIMLVRLLFTRDRWGSEWKLQDRRELAFKVRTIRLNCLDLL